MNGNKLTMTERGEFLGRIQKDHYPTIINLARMAFFDVRKLFNDDGTVKNPTELDDDTAAAIDGIKIKERVLKGKIDGHKVIERHIEVKTVDKLAATEKLGTYQKVFNQPIGIGGGNVNIQINVLELKFDKKGSPIFELPQERKELDGG
uniref:Putative terminase n=1 Tax=viral metagenome TaxID=1070528 RepID=A0A6M3KTJ0_9ZZZZ